METQEKGLVTAQNQELESITEILLQNSLGHELVFTRVKEVLPSARFQEVVVGEVSKAVSHIAQAVPMANIMTKGPLFRASCDPALLTKFEDGSTSTMIHGADGIKAHAGFNEVSSINPAMAVAVAMQAMAAISGQYYLPKVNGQLDQIRQGVDELIGMHHDEKIGILQNARKRLAYISSRQNNEEIDLLEIRSISNEIGNIFEEYASRLNREYEQCLAYESNELYIESKLDYLTDLTDKLNLSFQVCFQADKLKLHTALTEILIRMKLKHSLQIIEELFGKLRESYETSFFKNYEGLLKKQYVDIVHKAEELIHDTKLGKERVFVCIKEGVTSFLSGAQVEAAGKIENVADKLFKNNKFKPQKQLLQNSSRKNLADSMAETKEKLAQLDDVLLERIKAKPLALLQSLEGTQTDTVLAGFLSEHEKEQEIYYIPDFRNQTQKVYIVA